MAMRLVAVGVSHVEAPLEVRERVAVPPSGLRPVLRRLQEVAGEAVVLSTCNRTELYLAIEEDEAPEALFALVFPEAAADLRPFLFRYEGAAAARHLFRVASGIDSLVVGEAEVLGQVRRAWEAAYREGTTGPLTSRLFQRALAVGKRARAETEIGRFPASVASAGVVLARRVFGQDLSGCSVLLVGAGDVGQGVARCLVDTGVRRLMVANHREERAYELVSRYEATVVPWPVPTHVLAEADIVVTCTSAPEPIFRLEQVLAAVAARDGKPLHLIDLAVPRDVEPAVVEVRNVRLHNIDDLRLVVAESLERRQRTMPEVERIIEEETEKFAGWLKELPVIETLSRLRAKAERLYADEVQRALARLGHLTERDRRVVDILAWRLMNKLLHAPTIGLRRAAREGRGDTLRCAVEELFALAHDGQAGQRTAARAVKPPP